MDDQPWYASFVSWAMDKTFNGNKGDCNKALKGGSDSSVSTLFVQFVSANDMTNSPQPGEIIIFKNNGKSHTDLFETVNGNAITSIEGNIGSIMNITKMLVLLLVDINGLLAMEYIR